MFFFFFGYYDEEVNSYTQQQIERTKTVKYDDYYIF